MEILSVQNCSRFYGRGALQILSLIHISMSELGDRRGELPWPLRGMQRAGDAQGG